MSAHAVYTEAAISPQQAGARTGRTNGRERFDSLALLVNNQHVLPSPQPDTMSARVLPLNAGKRGRVRLESSRVATFIAGTPARILVLAHGFPWPDGSKTDDELARYAQESVERWTAFAAAHHAIVVAPTFGGRDFGGYRALFGRSIDADEFVNALVDEVGGKHIPRFSGRFSLHGHSAGGQFAARYLVTHPERLEAVVLSAPGAYPFPDPSLAWPNGMAAVVRDELSGSPEDGKASDQAAGSVYRPRPSGWLAAASEVPVNVLVGSRDTEPQWAEPGQPGSTRIERATAWVRSMREHAEASGRTPMIQFVQAQGLDHDEASMAVPAQEILAREWAD
jgi:pimeloyl-ACP methyl ester carboxylesterase